MRLIWVMKADRLEWIYITINFHPPVFSALIGKVLEKDKRLWPVWNERLVHFQLASLCKDVLDGSADMNRQKGVMECHWCVIHGFDMKSQFDLSSYPQESRLSQPCFAPSHWGKVLEKDKRLWPVWNERLVHFQLASLCKDVLDGFADMNRQKGVMECQVYRPILQGGGKRMLCVTNVTSQSAWKSILSFFGNTVSGGWSPVYVTHHYKIVGQPFTLCSMAITAQSNYVPQNMCIGTRYHCVSHNNNRFHWLWLWQSTIP